MRTRVNIVLYPNVITKTFSDTRSYEAELRVYRLNLPHVPLLLCNGKAEEPEESVWYISTKRIKAKPYLDEKGFDPARLAAALADFHRASMVDSKCICHIDNQPKNILLNAGDFYFVDFSDSREDYPETDVSHLLLFWAEEYEFIDFIRRAAAFLNSYQTQIPLDPQRWRFCLSDSIKRFDKRRLQHRGKNPAVHSPRNRNWLSEVI
ncbi:MAG: phosphotransferase [Candidatus Cloacimonadaceae bacterium]|jgi:thiamine kinase-like enzyme|nr:phosphotransferase [Candidatus Cloacimonadota bacterium]HCM16264.1 hypothetical protein [Candidatus Cloacimonas sp.]